MLKPSVPALFTAGLLISFFNIMIHTPLIHDWSENLPSWLVSTASHMEHHRVLSKHFAAPILNVDFFVAKALGGSLTEDERRKRFVSQGDPEDLKNKKVE